MKCAVLSLVLSVFFVAVRCTPIAEEGRKMSPEIICRQAYIIGDCIHTWSYDPSKGKCRQSCGNNENKFSSKEKCEFTCQGIFDRKGSDDSEEIRIKAFERVNEPNAKEPDLLMNI